MGIKHGGIARIKTQGVDANAANITLLNQESRRLCAETWVVLDSISICITEGLRLIPEGIPPRIQKDHSACRDFTIGALPGLYIFYIQRCISVFSGLG